MMCRVADAGDRRPASPLLYHNWYCDADGRDADHDDDYEHWDHGDAEHHSEHDGLYFVHHSVEGKPSETPYTYAPPLRPSPRFFTGADPIGASGLENHGENYVSATHS